MGRKEGIECKIDLAKRGFAFLESLHEKYKDASPSVRVIVVSHGGLIASIVDELLQFYGKDQYIGVKNSNASVITRDKDEKSWRVLSVNMDLVWSIHVHLR